MSFRWLQRVDSFKIHHYGVLWLVNSPKSSYLLNCPTLDQRRAGCSQQRPLTDSLKQGTAAGGQAELLPHKNLTELQNCSYTALKVMLRYHDRQARMMSVDISKLKTPTNQPTEYLIKFMPSWCKIVSPPLKGSPASRTGDQLWSPSVSQISPICRWGY